jgi:GT2 family glycosyltransferase
MNHVFCFVSSAKTEHFSALALDSFFKETKLEPGDIFVFVNNDGTNSFRKGYPIDIYINNKTPKSWAENFNKGLRIAKKFKKHFVVITNDIVFTKDWFEPLKQKDDAILIPACNINYIYKGPEFKTSPVMQMEEYVGKEKHLEAIVEFHKTRFKFDDVQEKIFMQMYLGRIPYQIHSEVGYFDHTFSNCGGEDMDYRIRCALKGFKTMIANHSLTLHFHGKSSWDGAESTYEEEQRRAKYVAKSMEKWGLDLTEIFIKGTNAIEHCTRIGLEKEIKNNESYNIMRILGLKLNEGLSKEQITSNN